MRSFLARAAGAPQARVSIRPERDYVFLNGHTDEAQGQYIRGKVVLFLLRGACADGVQLKMTERFSFGHRKGDSNDPSEWETGKVVMHQWNLVLSQSRLTQSSAFRNAYEWSFELLIPGNQQESFRGCSRCSIAYGLEASTINGTSHDLGSFVPIRIIRCPPMSSYELMDPVTADGKWAGKIEFCVSAAHQAIALGGLIPVDAQLAKLEPGVLVTKARFYLREHHLVHDQDVITFDAQRLVTEWPLETDNKDEQIHNWQQCLQLPLMVKKCSPDLCVSRITISHTLHFAATLLIDGVESEYEVSMPIYLFISPELPVTGWDVFERAGADITRAARDELAKGIQAPPKYCEDDDCVSDYKTLPQYPPPAYSEC